MDSARLGLSGLGLARLLLLALAACGARTGEGDELGLSGGGSATRPLPTSLVPVVDPPTGGTPGRPGGEDIPKAQPAAGGSGGAAGAAPGGASGAPPAEICADDWVEEGERCRLQRLIHVGATTLSDDSGDGFVSPGETLHLATSIMNTSSCTYSSSPSLGLRSSYPGLPGPGSVDIIYWWPNFVMNAGEQGSVDYDLVIPRSVPPGTRIDFRLVPFDHPLYPPECATELAFSIVVQAP